MLKDLNIKKESEILIYKKTYLDEIIKTRDISIFNTVINNLIDATNKETFLINTPIVNFFKNCKFNLNEFTTSVSVGLFVSLSPSISIALSHQDNLNNIRLIGEDLVSAFGIGVIKGVSIVTVIRLFNELMNGGNEHRIFKILKECLGVILAVVIIPKVPLIISLIVG